ncbi:putative membrane protein [Saccharothrix tamanrassetensis]|uniref:Putative membrane protein n=1 Tax=Saccharothrix tamanrassetensis TaxID=1051531 RepID=A0A841CDZ4_9PSEU|nr:DUF2306 domain-containing protein [Saccharothrix tamanrassetensis]MBB5953976.1 putative membrane protein [Saccharothrix tamanrassetensis]
MTSSTRAEWPVPAALILLTAVPVVAGAVRLTELAGGAEVTSENARFLAAPLPVVVHIVCAVLYCVAGAFQFAPGFRRRRPGRHRALGRLLVPAGLAAALTGLWMTLYYARADGDGDLLAAFRLVFGSAMAVSVVLGFAAIRRRDVARHRAWMIRGYAIGQGAGTQVLTTLPWVLVVGAPGEFARAMLLGAGWVVNLAVAEWLIRRRPARSARVPAAHVNASGAPTATG